MSIIPVFVSRCSLCVGVKLDGGDNVALNGNVYHSAVSAVLSAVMALSGNGLRLFASNEGYDCKSHNYCKRNNKNLFHFVYSFYKCVYFSRLSP